MQKVTTLPTKNTTRQNVDIITRDLPNLIELAKVMAKLRKANYDAYIEQGFDKQQALELCKIL